jgi:hypothetical protein
MSARYEHPYPAPDVEAQFPFERIDFTRWTVEDSRARATAFHEEMDRRRSVRMLSDEPVPRDLIEMAVRTASTAPSGAHQQPWQFVATADPEVKRRIREAAEAEERINYEEGRMNDEWQGALAALGTDQHKEFLEIAPWIVVLFEERYGVRDEGSRPHSSRSVRHRSSTTWAPPPCNADPSTRCWPSFLEGVTTTYTMQRLSRKRMVFHIATTHEGAS